MEPMKHVTWAAANEHINVYVRVIFSRHMRITYKRNDWTLKLLCTWSHQSATSLLRYFKFFFSHPSLPQNFKWYTVLLRRLVSSLDIFSELHEINLNLEMIVYPGLTQGGSPEKFCTLGWKNEIRWAGDPPTQIRQLYYIISINSGGNATIFGAKCGWNCDPVLSSPGHNSTVLSMISGRDIYYEPNNNILIY